MIVADKRRLLREPPVPRPERYQMALPSIGRRARGGRATEYTPRSRAIFPGARSQELQPRFAASATAGADGEPH